MIIKSVELKNYRNFARLCMDFHPHINLLCGENAQGKTNIIESIYMSSCGKSHRSSKEREIIEFGCDESHVKSLIEKKDISYRIDIHLKKDMKKGVAINGIPIKKISELLGIVSVVLFSPEDLSIIKNGPAERRKFIDTHLCLLDRIYVHELALYNKSLMQRNRLLKDLSYRDESMATLEIWDEQLIRYGKSIIKIREDFIDRINKYIRPIHETISSGTEKLELFYENDTTIDSYEEDMRKNRYSDLKYHITHVGPHRDDIGFEVNGMDIRKYGSQGQQKSAALSLKLSQIDITRSMTGEDPILLLDDVLSELDIKRQGQLLTAIKDIQTIITCTSADIFSAHHFHIDREYRVHDGMIEEILQR